MLDSTEVVDAMAAWRAMLTARPAPIQRDALVAHWDFDGSLADTSGRYQHGQTLKGDPTFGAGQVSRSVSFDAQTLVTLGTPKEFDVAKPFTVAFWFRPSGSKQPMPVMQQIDEQTRRGWESGRRTSSRRHPETRSEVELSPVVDVARVRGRGADEVPLHTRRMGPHCHRFRWRAARFQHHGLRQRLAR